MPCGLCSQRAAPPESNIPIRVALVKDADSVKIFMAGGYKIIDALTGKTLLEDRYLPAAYITPSQAGLKIGTINIDAVMIKLEAQGGSRIYINDRVYRGSIKILKNQDRLSVINILDLEGYLYGVIRNEVSTWWPMEALKAQVIAARTYALYQIKESRGRDYDVTADVGSQVYGGIFSENWRTNMAVDRTKGKVLAYNGAIFPAYFHATCGGGTLDASCLWSIDVPPLRGVKCRWCRRSPHYSWERWVSLKEARLKLEKAGYETGEILAVNATKKDPAGRILEMRIKGRENTVDISGKDFRLIIGPDILRSTNFKVAIIGGYMAFEGLGWGHGVGMCQWGAYYMSRAGKKTDEILKFYYPGSEIVNYGEITNDQIPNHK